MWSSKKSSRSREREVPKEESDEDDEDVETIGSDGTFIFLTRRG
jgi:hypothetical protein